MKEKFSKLAFKFAKSPAGDFLVGITFSKFSKLIPVKRVKENDKVIAFYHPKPFWENHIVIVPKKQIKKITYITDEDKNYIFEVFKVAAEIVEELGWEEKGYSIMANGGKRQEVNQIHFHLHSGKFLN